MHFLLTQHVWFSYPLGIHIPNNVSLNTWLQNLLSKPEKLASQLFSLALWKLWEGRNQLIFKNEKFCPITNAAADFNSANFANPIQTVRESPASSEPPEQFNTKVNVDAGCFSNGTTGCGLIMRNHLGIAEFAVTHKRRSKLLQHWLKLWF